MAFKMKFNEKMFKGGLFGAINEMWFKKDKDGAPEYDDTGHSIERKKRPKISSINAFGAVGSLFKKEKGYKGSWTYDGKEYFGTFIREDEEAEYYRTHNNKIKRKLKK